MSWHVASRLVRNLLLHEGEQKVYLDDQTRRVRISGHGCKLNVSPNQHGI